MSEINPPTEGLSQEEKDSPKNQKKQKKGSRKESTVSQKQQGNNNRKESIYTNSEKQDGDDLLGYFGGEDGKNKESNLLSSDLLNQINSEKDPIDFNINPFNEGDSLKHDDSCSDIELMIENENEEFHHYDIGDNEPMNFNYNFVPNNTYQQNNYGQQINNMSGNSHEKLNLSHDNNNNNNYMYLKQQFNLDHGNNKIPRVPSFGHNMNNYFTLGQNGYVGNSGFNSSFGYNNSYHNTSFDTNRSVPLATSFGNWVCEMCGNTNTNESKACIKCRKPRLYKSNMVNSSQNLREASKLAFQGSIFPSSPSNYNHQLNLSDSAWNNKHQGLTRNKFNLSNSPNMFNNDLRRKKPFIEREGDWVCSTCKNLNFAFRLNCNRCNQPKNENSKIIHISSESTQNSL